MKKIISLFALFCVLATLCSVLSACAPTGKAAYDTSLTGEGISVRMSKVKAQIDSMEVDDFEPSDQESDFVLIRVKNYGDIVVALRRDIAPETVKNFKALVAKKFYSETVFHRVMDGFMIQGGGFVVIGDSLREKDADTIKGEFTDNDFVNNLTHVRGVISMARVGGLNDSASSQFFIMHQTTATLNEKYASFGYVLAGMDVVDKIATCPVDDKNSQSPAPLTPVVIESITFVQPK